MRFAQLLLLAASLFSLSAAADDIKIGYTASLTGAHVAEGAYQQKSIKLAVKQINDGGGINGRKIVLVTEDTHSTNEGAVDAFRALAETHKVAAVVGSSKSTHALGFAPIASKDGVPTLIGGTNPRITESGNRFVFRVRPDDSIVALGMVRFIKEDLKLTKIGIINDADAFGSGGANLVEKNANELGIKVVKRESYKLGTRDFKPLLRAIKEAGAEVVVVYGTSTTDSGYLLKEYRDFGAPFPLIGSASCQQQAALQIAKEKANGIYAMADAIPGSSPASKKFVEDFKKEYHEEADMSHAYSYDAMNLLALAIKTAGSDDRAKIRDALAATKGYQGVLGTYSFNKNGDGLFETNVVRIENDAAKLVRTIHM